MCECVEKVRTNIMQLTGADNIILPIDLITGKVYLNAEQINIKNGKTKRSIINVFLDACPFCYEKYPPVVRKI